MNAVFLVIHLIFALAIVGLVLLQRSEGGGLGIGGGGGLGGLTTARGAANVLSRATAICAAGFFATSLILGVMAGAHSRKAGVMDMIDNVPAVAAEADAGKDEKIPLTPAPPVSK